MDLDDSRVLGLFILELELTPNFYCLFDLNHLIYELNLTYAIIRKIQINKNFRSRDAVVAQCQVINKFTLEFDNFQI